MIGANTKAAIQSLAEKRPEPSDLAPPGNPNPILAQTGLGQANTGTGTGNGLLFDLTETTYEARTWHANALTTIDTAGVLPIVWDLPNEMTFTDGGTKTGKIILKAPAA